MSEITESQPVPPAGPPPRFDTIPYRPDRGFTSANSALLLGVFLVAGTVLGIIAFYVSKLIWLVMVFPLLIGLILGGIGIWVVKRHKIRHPALAGVAGFLGGCLAMLAMHYAAYLDYRSEERAVRPAKMIELFEKPPEQREAFFAMFQGNVPAAEIEPVRRMAQAYHSFFGFMNDAAEQGVEIKSTRGGGKETNLGYVGSWIYWGLEVLIIAGISFAMVRSKASEPFCTDCGTWKNRVPVASLGVTGDRLDEAVRDGEPWAVLKDGSPPPEREAADLFVDVCPQCQDKAPFEVQTVRRRWNKKREMKGMETYARVTYPGEALPVLLAQFQPPQPPAAEAPVVAEVAEPETSEAKPNREAT
jgi:hypothetical protein